MVRQATETTRQTNQPLTLEREQRYTPQIEGAAQLARPALVYLHRGRAWLERWKPGYKTEAGKVGIDKSDKSRKKKKTHQRGRDGQSLPEPQPWGCPPCPHVLLQRAWLACITCRGPFRGTRCHCGRCSNHAFHNNASEDEKPRSPFAVQHTRAAWKMHFVRR